MSDNTLQAIVFLAFFIFVIGISGDPDIIDAIVYWIMK